MFIIDRIRAHGGEVIRTDWRFRLLPGKMSESAIAWVKEHKDELFRDLWPEFDAWKARAEELTATGTPRCEAEAAAYAEVMRSTC